MATGGVAALNKKWNRPMLDGAGKPEQIVVRGKTFTLRERHRPVLGPKIVAKADAMKTLTRFQRVKHALVLGFGEGATKAPPAEGRFEAGLLGRRHR